MSILFDEQKNINNAIWHMERAFEVQPSNTATRVSCVACMAVAMA
jgi:hypothetical protein